MTAGTGVSLLVATAPGEEAGRELVARLVEERRIACGNVLPGMTSIYRWQGTVHADAEALVLMKARSAQVDEVIARVAELHPYDVPEVLAVPVEAGLASYCRWVLEETA